MPRRHRLWHLLAPAGVALAAMLVGLTQGHIAAVGDWIAALLYTPLFFAAPHLLWMGVCVLTKASPRVEHTGLLITTCVLAGIGLLSWLLPGDPSGLPYLWLLYWPLSAALLALLLIGWLLMHWLR